jgi:hypothetical protein
MTLTGGKRKVNKGLRDWVAFVKRVQKEEKLNYKDAIHRAKQRKDKGEKWMSGGNHNQTALSPSNIKQGGDGEDTDYEMDTSSPMAMNTSSPMAMDTSSPMEGGRRTRRRRTVRRGKKCRKTMRRSRGRSRSSRRH